MPAGYLKLDGGGGDEQDRAGLPSRRRAAKRACFVVRVAALLVVASCALADATLRSLGLYAGGHAAAPGLRGALEAQTAASQLARDAARDAARNATGSHPATEPSLQLSVDGVVGPVWEVLRVLAPYQVLIEIALALACLLILLPMLVNFAIKELLESVDRFVLSVDVHIQQLRISWLRRSFVMEELVVDNPLDSYFRTPSMLRCQRVEVGITYGSIWRSWGKQCDVRWLRISQLEVYVEYTSLHSPSNVQMVADFIDSRKPQANGRRAKTDLGKMGFHLHEVDIPKIMVHVLLPLMDTALPCYMQDIFIQDFAAGETSATLEDIMRTIVKNVLGRAQSAADGTPSVRRKLEEAMDVAVRHTMKAFQEVGKTAEENFAQAMQRGKEVLHLPSVQEVSMEGAVMVTPCLNCGICACGPLHSQAQARGVSSI